MYDSSHEPLPPPRQIIGQYSEAFPRHDANLDAPIDEAMARRWHELARQHGVETPMPSVDGALTRGEFLQQLHRGAPR